MSFVRYAVAVKGSSPRLYYRPARCGHHPKFTTSMGKLYLRRCFADRVVDYCAAGNITHFGSYSTSLGQFTPIECEVIEVTVS